MKRRKPAIPDWMVLAVCIAVLATGVIVAVSRKTSKAAK